MKQSVMNANEYCNSIIGLLGGITGDCPEMIFYANEEPWRNKPYSVNGNHWQTIGRTGCGPASCANVVTALTGEYTTPEDIAEFSTLNGHRTAWCGTRWTLYKDIVEHYGFTYFVQSSRWNDCVDCIGAGGRVICSMRKGFWGNNGNCIFVWGYDKTHVYAVDPYNRRRKRQGIENFIQQCHQYFCYYPVGYRCAYDITDEEMTRVLEVSFQ